MDPQQELFSALLLELKNSIQTVCMTRFYRRKARHIRLSIWQTVI